MNNTLGAFLVGIVALLSLWVWGNGGRAALEHITCPSPVRVEGQLVSCTGQAVVSLPGGGTAVITAPSPSAQARR